MADLSDWIPQEEIMRDICTDEVCGVDKLWPAVRFAIHASIEPDNLTEEQRPLFEGIRAKRVRTFIIQVGAIAQMMELNENEVAMGCFNLCGSAARSLEERIFAGVFDSQKWRSQK